MKTKLLVFLITLSAVCVCGGQSRIPGPGGLFNYPTYTDAFIRSNGPLSAPWSIPAASTTGGGLSIVSNQVLATSGTPGAHFFEIYAGTFSQNQYCKITANNVATTGPFATQGCIVRGLASNQYYNDIIPTPTGNSGDWAVGYEDGTDFCPGTALFSGATAYVAGDTHELDVVGSGPVFFWGKHNGLIEATCLENSRNYTTGVPGFGSGVDMNSTPTVASGTVTLGSLPGLPATAFDNFAGANDGWLGRNWWFAPTETCALTRVSNKATLLGTGCPSGPSKALAIWTTSIGLTQTPQITLGTSYYIEGPVARYTPSISTANYYHAFWYSGAVYLYASTGGGDNQLGGGALCSLGSAPTTLELDASGSSPVVLTVKASGSTCGSSVSDSTYNLTGTYSGFMVEGTGATVLGWMD